MILLRMRKTILKIAVIIFTMSLTGCTSLTRKNDLDIKYRRLPVREYRDKLQAGWLGQIVGVSWAAPPNSSGKTKLSL